MIKVCHGHRRGNGIRTITNVLVCLANAGLLTEGLIAEAEKVAYVSNSLKDCLRQEMALYNKSKSTINPD